MNNILEEIVKERDYQNKKWGKAFDDKNTINDWTTYISQYALKAIVIGATLEDKRTALLKVAALAVAAIETLDRNGKFAPRHYDVVTKFYGY